MVAHSRCRCGVPRTRDGSAIATLLLVLIAACGEADRSRSALEDTSRPETDRRVPSVGTALPESAGLPLSAGGLPRNYVLSDADMARAVIETYYDAIDSREYRRAYAQWGEDGKRSGQTFEEFASGFNDTGSVEVTFGQVGRVEGAAGSQYVEIPVSVAAVTRSGEVQRFEGTYTLRRTLVDGATTARRRWHIFQGKLHSVR